MNIELSSLTTVQLRHAADLKEKIDALNKELTSLLGISVAAATKSPIKRKMSVGARAKIGAAQKTRWAKVTAAKPSPKIPAKKKGMSAAVKAKISAAATARWVKVKAAGKTSL